MRALTVTAFKKRFEITQHKLNELVKLNRVHLQQNGYLGHSLFHHKLVIFPDDFRLRPKQRSPKLEYRRRWLSGKKKGRLR